MKDKDKGNEKAAEKAIKSRKRKSAAQAKVVKSGNANAVSRFELRRRFRSADPAYWDQPLAIRLYLRILYAFLGFVMTSYVFDVLFNTPFWMQMVLSCAVAITILVFRIAYPGGAGNVWEWTMEGIAEAAEEREAKGKKSRVSSDDARSAIKDGGAMAWATKMQKKEREKDTLFSKMGDAEKKSKR